MTTTSRSSEVSRLISLLLERSVTRGDFVLASGRKSSYYIDARRTTMSGEGQLLIGQLGLAALDQQDWAPRAVGGLTLGADPVAYAIAHAARRAGRTIDAFTVRKEAKGHGLGRRIEGNLTAGDPVVVVEDVITTGHSALEAVTQVRQAGGQVLGVLAVVDREEGGREAIAAGGVPATALVLASELRV
jgi:orotate phosphoribosyltransferase